MLTGNTQSLHQIFLVLNLWMTPFEKTFSLSGEREKSAAAKNHLRSVGKNRIPFSDLLLRRKMDLVACVQRSLGFVRVDDKIEFFKPALVGAQPVNGKLQDDRKSIVIPVRISQSRRHHDCRAKFGNLRSDLVDYFFTVRNQEIGNALIRQMQKPQGFNWQPQSGRREHHFGTAARPPTSVSLRTNSPMTLNETLRPRVVVTIRKENDANYRSRLQRLLQQAAGRDGFIIGVGREHQHPLQLGCVQGSAHLRSLA
ncbi:MAG TPA: hypothetical protein VF437_00110 [Verrucomicrobiae bacterium]